MRTFGGLGYAVESIGVMTVESVWVGNVDTDSATVKCRIPDSASATMRYSTDPGLAGYSTAVGAEGADEVFTFNLSGLSAGTRYYYGFAGSDVAGSFKTFPASGSFGIAFASCAGTVGGDYEVGVVSDSPAFDFIRARDPALFIHLGDRGYPDIGSNNPSLYRANYQSNMAMQRQLDLHLAMPVAYVWDDHDFGPDDSHAGSAGKPAAQSVYREHVPHWTLPASDSIQQTFTVGRVRFILLDVRSYRSAHGATDNSSKTVLGATQKQWLKDTLLAATEPLIVLATVNAWLGTASITWGVYTFERQELAEFFEDNNLTDRLLLINGDHHMLAADDGTNTQYDPGSLNPGPPAINAAPLDAGFTSFDSGTWSEGVYKTTRQQYATIDFTDTGSAITARMRGWACSGTTSEAVRFDFSKVYPG